MARDKLGILLSVRKREVDRSRQGLAACLKAENAARQAIRAIDDAMARERAAAEPFPERPYGAEIFAAWVKRARAERVEAVAALAAAESRTEAARRALAEARAAARVVEHTMDERDFVARAEAEKREQHAIDDIGRGLRAARDKAAESQDKD